MIDDAEIIRKATAELLTFSGYKVEKAVDRKKTVTLYRQATAAGAPYQAVIMDLTVPTDMGGVDTMAALLRQPDPQLLGIYLPRSENISTGFPTR